MQEKKDVENNIKKEAIAKKDANVNAESKSTEVEIMNMQSRFCKKESLYVTF